MLNLLRSLLDQFLKRPELIRNTRRHGRGNPQALAQAHEIVACKRAYAWSHERPDGKRRFFAVLHFAVLLVLERPSERL